MPTTELPQAKEKAAEISRKIANTRPSKRDKNSPDGQVTGGFNQKRDEEVVTPPAEEHSATRNDRQ
jgi:hypothetical protein